MRYNTGVNRKSTPFRFVGQFLLVVFALVGSFHFSAQPALAAEACTSAVVSRGFTYSTNWPTSYTAGFAPAGIYLRIDGINSSERWGIRVLENRSGPDRRHRHYDFAATDYNGDGNLDIADLVQAHGSLFDNPDSDDSEMILELYRNDRNNWEADDPGFVCEITRYEIISQDNSLQGELIVEQQDSNGNWGQGCIEYGKPVRFTIRQWLEQGSQQISSDSPVHLHYRSTSGLYCTVDGFVNGTNSITLDPGGSCGDLVYFPSGANREYEFVVSTTESGPGNRIPGTDRSVQVYAEGSCTDEDVGSPPPEDPDEIHEKFEICRQIPTQPALGNCQTCVSNNGVWTAIGCIPSNPQGMIETIMGVGLSLAGGVCLLMMLAAGFTFSTSQGDPKKTGQAKEMMTSAIVGLVFILLSVTLLQFIGVSLLGIPGFGQ